VNKESWAGLVAHSLLRSSSFRKPCRVIPPAIAEYLLVSPPVGAALRHVFLVVSYLPHLHLSRCIPPTNGETSVKFDRAEFRVFMFRPLVISVYGVSIRVPCCSLMNRIRNTGMDIKQIGRIFSSYLNDEPSMKPGHKYQHADVEIRNRLDHPDQR